MEIKKLQEAEQRLIERKERLEVSIQELKKNLTEGNLENTAEKIRQLETQLRLTGLALQSNQDKLQELEKLLSSKEYKDKLKMQEKLSKQAQEQTRAFYEKLFELRNEAQEVEKLADKFNQLQKETMLEKNFMQAYSKLENRQPFIWLFNIAREMDRSIKEAKFIKDKLEV